MKIEWAPIAVPIERRLQTLAAAAQILFLLSGEIVCSLTVIVLLVSAQYMRYCLKLF